jgi:hypothetical protein
MAVIMLESGLARDLRSALTGNYRRDAVFSLTMWRGTG